MRDHAATRSRRIVRHLLVLGVAFGVPGTIRAQASAPTPAAAATPLDRARALLAAGELAQAADSFRAIVRGDSLNAAAWNGLGAALNRLERYAEALDAQERAVRLAPANVGHRFNRALVYWEVGRFDDGIRDLDSVIALRPAFAPAYAERGAALASAGRMEEAQRAWARGLEVDSSYIWSRYYRGVWAVAEGRYADAIADLDAVTARETLTSAWLWRWVAYRRSGRAAPSLGEYPDAWPGPVAAFLAGGIDADSLMRAARAMALPIDARRALSAWTFIAHARLAEGRTDDARRAFAEALRLRAPRHAERASAERELRRLSSGTQGAADTSRASLPALHHEAVAFDARRNRLVVFAGDDSLSGTWEWDGRRWRLAADSASGPPHKRVGAQMAFDPASGRLVLTGGWGGSARFDSLRTSHCDTWTFDGRRWERADDGPCVTDRVRNHSLVFDTRRRALLLLDGTPELPGQAPRALRTWRWERGAWVLVDSTGPRRAGWNRGVYDEARGQVVYPVFEGPDEGVWEWDGVRWTHVRATGPAARHAHSLGWDPLRRRVLLLGGQTVTRPSTFFGDAWTWDGERWSELRVEGTERPGARAGAALVADAGNGRMLLFGGYSGPPFRFHPELWILDGRGWRRWEP